MLSLVKINLSCKHFTLSIYIYLKRIFIQIANGFTVYVFLATTITNKSSLISQVRSKKDSVYENFTLPDKNKKDSVYTNIFLAIIHELCIYCMFTYYF